MSDQIAIAPRQPKVMLIVITMESEEGTTTTWTAGQGVTEDGLIARWERENPTLAKRYKSHEVVTPSRNPDALVIPFRDAPGTKRNYTRRGA